MKWNQSYSKQSDKYLFKAKRVIEKKAKIGGTPKVSSTLGNVRIHHHGVHGGGHEKATAPPKEQWTHL